MSKKAKSEFASDIEELMKNAYGDVDMGKDATVVTTVHPLRKFQDLSQDILKDILLCMTDPKDYEVPVPMEVEDETKQKKKKRRNPKPQYGLKEKEMIRSVWQMQGVCVNFRAAFEKMSKSEWAAFPRPSIGLRIMPKPPKQKQQEYDEEKFRVLIYVYGDFSRNNFVQAVDPYEISEAIFPAVITTQLIIQGFLLEDAVVDMLKLMDTSKVEEVYFNDIKGIDLERFTISDVVALFPEAMEIRFLGDQSVESLSQLSVDIPEMTRESYTDIKTGELVSMYHAVDIGDESHQRLSRKLNAFYREVKNKGLSNAKKEKKERNGKSISRLSSLLNDEEIPKKKPRTLYSSSGDESSSNDQSSSDDE